MKNLPAFACFAAALLLLLTGGWCFLDPPGFALEPVLTKVVGTAYDLAQRRGNADPRFQALMPFADAVLGDYKLTDSGQYVLRVTLKDRYDPEGVHTSRAGAKVKAAVADAEAKKVPFNRSGAVSRAGRDVTITVGSFRVPKAGLYKLYAELSDAKDVAETATVTVEHVATGTLFALLGVGLLFAVALGAAGAIILK